LAQGMGYLDRLGLAPAAKSAAKSAATPAKPPQPQSTAASQNYLEKLGFTSSGGHASKGASAAEEESKEEEEVIEEETVPKAKAKPKYWWEPGYVAEAEEEAAKGQIMTLEQAKVQAAAEAADDEDDRRSEDSQDGYEEVVPNSGATLGTFQYGGQPMRWGGISGRLCLEDGDKMLALEDGKVPALEEVLDELLVVGDDDSGTARAGLRVAEDEPEQAVLEVVATQMPYDPGATSRWSNFNVAAMAASASRGSASSSDECLAIVEASAVRNKYAIEVGEENEHVRSEEVPYVPMVVMENDMLRKQIRQEIIAKAKKDTLKRWEYKREEAQSNRGGCERLPGTRKPMGISQTWQDKKAETQGTAPAAAPKSASRPLGRSMLPGALAGFDVKTAQPAGKGAPSRPAAGEAKRGYPTKSFPGM